MTAYVTRSPLQLIQNSYMMNEPRRSSRRLSARLGDKEDVPMVNGVAHSDEKGKTGQNLGKNAKQAKAVVNGAASGAAGTKTKRKLDYDEETDGFRFTRTRAKKAKAELESQIPPIVEEKHEESLPKPVPVKKPRKRTSGSPSASGVENGEKVERRRRSARNSGDKDIVQQEPPLPPLEVKKKRKPKDSGSQETQKTKKQDRTASTQAQETATTTSPRTQHIDKPLEPIKVSLPFADTPIIRRNQEMRRGAENGSRRSSLGMRGRRASSLIDSGKSDAALPHDEVDTSEYYKHIESTLTEPRRMKQLLTWCGTRALGEKPVSSQPDFQARLAAREIQQQLLKDFSTKSEMSDWFNRKDTTPPPQPPKPNPKNISNENRIRDLEQQLEKYALHSKKVINRYTYDVSQASDRASNLGNPSPPSIRVPFSITRHPKPRSPFYLRRTPRLTKSGFCPKDAPIIPPYSDHPCLHGIIHTTQIIISLFL
ncbi:MAG: hypothetical protein Q9219_003742 [cf. Caloplaca sp. 3 TL-2023]